MDGLIRCSIKIKMKELQAIDVTSIPTLAGKTAEKVNEIIKILNKYEWVICERKPLKKE